MKSKELSAGVVGGFGISFVFIQVDSWVFTDKNEQTLIFNWAVKKINYPRDLVLLYDKGSTICNVNYIGYDPLITNFIIAFRWWIPQCERYEISGD